MAREVLAQLAALAGFTALALAATVVLELATQPLVAIAVACFASGYGLGRVLIAREAQPTALLVLGLACGWLTALAYVALKVYAYAVSLEAAGQVGASEFLAMLLGSGVLATMVLIHGVVAAVLAAAGVGLSLLTAR